MSAARPSRRRQREAGIALLIAIFVLLLIGVVAISLIVSSGTESALAGNYRSSTAVYYAAVAGLEEVRARLRSNNPNYFNNTNPGFLPAPVTPLLVCSPIYLINPFGGEAITPWDLSSAYPDKEFGQEYAGICGAIPSPSPTALSIWNVGPLSGLGFPGPRYKWVRINGVSEQSLNLDTWPTYDGISPNLIYYDGTHLTEANTNGQSQVLQVTSLAVLPNGSQKLLQYLVAGVPPPIANFPGNLFSFPAALTMAGNSVNGVAFSAPTSNNSYFVSGADITPTCGLGAAHAIGVFDDPDKINVVNGGNGGGGILPTSMRSKYTGVINPGPDVVNLISQGLVSSNLGSPDQVDLIAQTVTENADVIIPSNATPTYPLPTFSGSQLSASASGMSSTNPMSIVVNGNLDLTGWHNTGYGMLLVIGNLNYDPDASWQGMILVIGQGTITGSKSGSGEIDGQVFVANTRDASGNLLSTLGTSSAIFANNLGGNGIRYSSCAVQSAQLRSSYKILSFHEIPQ